MRLAFVLIFNKGCLSDVRLALRVDYLAQKATLVLYRLKPIILVETHYEEVAAAVSSEMIRCMLARRFTQALCGAQQICSRILSMECVYLCLLLDAAQARLFWQLDHLVAVRVEIAPICGWVDLAAWEHS